MTNEEARVAFKYHFSLKLMEKLPAKCLCGHSVGDGTHLEVLVCKKVNAGQITAHDVAVRMIGAELNSYGVVAAVRYEQRASHDKERERKRTDMELNFDGRRVAVDYTVPDTLTVKQRTAGIKYDPYEVRNAAQILKNNKYADVPRSQGTTIMNLFPWSQSHLEGLGTRLSSSSTR